VPTPNLMWAYPWDLLDEGIGPALDRMQARAKVTDVAVTAVYHAGKFLHPNNPRRKIVFPVSGTLYFPPQRSWYGRQRITPPVWPEVQTDDFWPALRHETAARGMGLSAWALCLHNSGVGSEYIDCTVENAFGDRLATDLCPANPDVGAYLTAVVRDIASTRQVDRIMLESLEFMPFQHGFHHEVIGVPVGPTVGLLMALCFCEHCLGAAQQHGVDGAAVRRWVVEQVNDHFADPFAHDPPHWSWAQLREAADGQLGLFLDVRQRIVADLARRVVAAIRDASDCTVAVIDFGPLYPHGPDGTRWESGADVEVLAGLVDEVPPTFSFTDPDVHVQKVRAYLDMLDARLPVHPAIRAILPQTGDPEALAAQLAPLSGHIDGISFYNYGFMARQTLDWIGGALDGLEVMERQPSKELA
jgi:hypothetical protein